MCKKFTKLLVLGLFSAMLLSGCGKDKEAPVLEAVVQNNEDIATEKSENIIGKNTILRVDYGLDLEGVQKALQDIGYTDMNYTVQDDEVIYTTNFLGKDVLAVIGVGEKGFDNFSLVGYYEEEEFEPRKSEVLEALKTTYDLISTEKGKEEYEEYITLTKSSEDNGEQVILYTKKDTGLIELLFSRV